MSQPLTLELDAQTYEAIRRRAEAVGTSPAQVAREALERHFVKENGPGPGRSRTEADRQEARERFERHFGEVDLGSPTGSDNESIDADLAREYADAHEEN